MLTSTKGREDAGEDAARPAAGKGQGDFFAVDRRTWARACDLGLNPAVAYLVLARGTSPLPAQPAARRCTTAIWTWT
jgi:hypothetical protein